MGLDMTLYREVQLKGKMKITDNRVAEILDNQDTHMSVREGVCYWRKFNALHKYFADNFNEQDNDNCVDMYMEIDDIIQLRDKLEVLRKQIKLGDGWAMNGGSADTVKRGTEIELIDGSKKKVEDLKIGDEIKIESEHCPSGRAVICYTTTCGTEDEIRYSYNYQERGQVVLNPEVCEKTLPTESGFFFGSTNYDEGYVWQINDTIRQLNKVIDDHYKLVNAGVEAYDIDYYYRAWY